MTVTTTDTRPRITEDTEEFRGYLGRTPEGDRVWGELRITTRSLPRTFNGEPVAGWTTVEHEQVHRFTELAMTGLVVSKGRRVVDMAGQCLDTARHAEPDRSKAHGRRGLSESDPVAMTAFLALWARHHLNGMNAGCSHQTAVGTEVGERLDQTPACPHSGYRYGHAWLVEPLDAHVVTRARQVGAALDGTRPKG